MRITRFIKKLFGQKKLDDEMYMRISNDMLYQIDRTLISYYRVYGEMNVRVISDVCYKKMDKFKLPRVYWRYYEPIEIYDMIINDIEDYRLFLTRDVKGAQYLANILKEAK